MKNAQDEGLKPQPTDITASSVVINKSEENSPQIQIPLVNEDSTKTQPITVSSLTSGGCTCGRLSWGSWLTIGFTSTA